jgi:hypothetical protein
LAARWTADHPVLRACKFNGGNSARDCQRVDFCASTHHAPGPRSSRSNTKTGRGWPGIEMGDRTGRPHNLFPSYLDRSSFCAPQSGTIQDEHVDQIPVVAKKISCEAIHPATQYHLPGSWTRAFHFSQENSACISDAKNMPLDLAWAAFGRRPKPTRRDIFASAHLRFTRWCLTLDHLTTAANAR